MALSRDSEYNIAAIVLGALLLLVNFIIWVISLFKCRRLGDPARGGLRWMKLCAPLLCGYILFLVVACVMEILFIETGSEFEADQDYLPFLHAERFLQVFQRFSLDLTLAVLFLTLVYIGLGILQARTGEAKQQRHFLWTAKGIVGLLVVIAIALLGVSLNYQKDIVITYDARFAPTFQQIAGDDLDSQGLNVRKLSGALTILFFVIAVGTVAFSVFVLVRISKSHAHLRKSAGLLLAAAVVYLEANLFSVVIMALYYKFSDLSSALNVPPYLAILAIIFEALPLVLLLLLLAFLGQLKQGGLWSANSAHGQPTHVQPASVQPAPQQYAQYQQPPQAGFAGSVPHPQQQMSMAIPYQYGPQYPGAPGVAYQTHSAPGPQGAAPQQTPSPVSQET